MSNAGITGKSSIKKQKYFIDDWLQDDLFKVWLAKDKDNTKARCKICHKTLELSTSGRSALTDHAKGAKHLAAVKKVTTFFQPKLHKTGQTVSYRCPSDSVLPENNQETLDTFLITSTATKAEIIWSLKSVMSGFSNRSNDELSSTFAAMFPDSNIAKSFNLARTKAMYTITHGLAPYFKSVLVSSLTQSEIHVYAFDESLNDVTQNCEMDIYIRFWDSVNERVQTRYYGSSFLGHTTYQDLTTHFVNLTSELPASKLYQISMDGPNVNLKFFKEFLSHHKSNCHHSLIDIGSCNLHIIHGSLVTGEKESGWGLKKVLKGAYQIFHDSPARREDYESITGSRLYPYCFCSTR